MSSLLYISLIKKQEAISASRFLHVIFRFPACQLFRVPVFQSMESATIFHMVGQLMGKGNTQLLFPCLFVPIIPLRQSGKGTVVQVDIVAQQIGAGLAKDPGLALRKLRIGHFILQ